MLINVGDVIELSFNVFINHVNGSLDFGNTPGHYASEGGHPECLSCYLYHEGDIENQNIKGETPLDSARKAGHPLLMQKASK